MDAETFKAHLKEVGHSYSTFAKLVSVPVSTVKTAVSRNQVPLNWAGLLEDLVSALALKPVSPPGVVSNEAPVSEVGSEWPEVTEEYAKAKGYDTRDMDHVRAIFAASRGFLAKPSPDRTTVVTPGPKAEYDIMSDGYARGRTGDSNLMRAHYRTPEAWSKINGETKPAL